MNKEATEKFLKDNFNNKEDKVAILIGSPDPDSIGSGVGMKLLINHISGAKCDIIYKGEISHPQNRTLVNVLNIDLIEENKAFNNNPSLLKEKYSKIIFVDHIPKSEYKEIPISIVIDHHKTPYDNPNTLVDIRNVGACCSIVWEYIENIGYKMSQDNDIDVKTATVMLFGIKTDTGDLVSENTTELDFKAYQSIACIVKEDDISHIINYKYPAYFFEVRSRLDNDENSVIKDSFFIGGIEFISQARRDCLPMLADERVRMEGISTSLIFAVVGDNLEVSVRSSNPAIDVNKLCKDIFGDDFAGGRVGAGAAKIPLGILSASSLPDDMKNIAWKAYKALIINKILNYCVGH